MAPTNMIKALPPIEFRFTDPDDAGKFGDGWFVYSETDIMRKPARELIELEVAMGLAIVSVMNGMRQGSVIGDTAAAWIGVRETDLARAGEFDAFNPITMAIEWRDPPGKAPAARPAATPEPPELSLPEIGPRHDTTSAQTDTVILQSLPIAE